MKKFESNRITNASSIYEQVSLREKKSVRKVFWCFQQVEKGCIGNKCVKRFFPFLFQLIYKP